MLTCCTFLTLIFLIALPFGSVLLKPPTLRLGFDIVDAAATAGAAAPATGFLPYSIGVSLTRPAASFSLHQVSVVGHSLGSIITHDILMAQPIKGQTGLAAAAVSLDIPVLRYTMCTCRASGVFARCLIRHEVTWCTRCCPFLSFKILHAQSIAYVITLFVCHDLLCSREDFSLALARGNLFIFVKRSAGFLIVHQS